MKVCPLSTLIDSYASQKPVEEELIVEFAPTREDLMYYLIVVGILWIEVKCTVKVFPGRHCEGTRGGLK